MPTTAWPWSASIPRDSLHPGSRNRRRRCRASQNRLAHRARSGVRRLAPLWACGWPALFLWGRGGALRWCQLGEGDYNGTEQAIHGLSESDSGHDWPPVLEPMRPSDSSGAEGRSPPPRSSRAGSTEEPWSSSPDDPSLEFEYTAGGAYAATNGGGEDRDPPRRRSRRPIEVTCSGLGADDPRPHRTPRTRARAVAEPTRSTRSSSRRPCRAGRPEPASCARISPGA